MHPAGLLGVGHTQAKQGGVGTAPEAMLLSMTLRYLVAQSWLKKLLGTNIHVVDYSFGRSSISLSLCSRCLRPNSSYSSSSILSFRACFTLDSLLFLK